MSAARPLCGLGPPSAIARRVGVLTGPDLGPDEAERLADAIAALGRAPGETYAG